MTEYELTIRPFVMGTEKEAALKPLEEAAEAFGAYQEIDRCGGPDQCVGCELRDTCDAPIALADEVADVVQAACNLAARYGIDVDSAMRRCEWRNRRRGRYDCNG